MRMMTRRIFVDDDATMMSSIVRVVWMFPCLKKDNKRLENL